MTTFSEFSTLTFLDTAQSIDGTTFGVRFNGTNQLRIDNVNNIGATQTLTTIGFNQSATNGSFDVDLQATEGGGVLVAFQTASGNSFRIAQFEVYSATGSRDFRVSYDSTEPMGGVAAVSLGDNTSILLRSESDGVNGYDLLMTRVNAFGLEVQSEVNLTTSSGVDELDPVAILQANGNIAIASIRDDGVNERVQVNIVQPDGTVLLTRLLSPLSHEATNIDLVELAGGNMVAIWEDEANGGVFLRVLDAAGGLVTGIVAVHNNADRAISGKPDIVALSDGGFAVSIGVDVNPGNSSTDDVLYRTYDASGTATSALLDANISFNFSSSSSFTQIYELDEGMLAVGDFGGARVIGEEGTRFRDFIEATGAGVYNLFAEDDVFEGSSQNDTVFGGNGSDQIRGNAGDDFIAGGASSPGTGFGEGTQVLRGGAGNDVITATGASQFYGDEGDDVIAGSMQDDTIFGGAGEDLIRTRGGDDSVEGGNGNDSIRSGGGDDTIFGGAGRDSIRAVEGAEGDMVVYGGSGVDTIIAGDGDDVIFGGDSGDIIEGRGGNDALFGGDGSDRFQFRFDSLQFDMSGNVIGGGLGEDVIHDFANGPDRLRIDTQLAANFADLTWIEVGANVEIEFANGQGSIVLMNMAGLFDASDVIFF
ncbi:MAG: calcium-binding protein [Pseudomonadota bacterium]